MKARVAVIALASALFAGVSSLALDLNQNQMSDVWESIFSVPPDAGAEDGDSDGFDNRVESLAGTNPWDPLSRLHLEMFFEPEELRLRIQTEAGKRYEIESSIDLTSWFLGGTEEPTTGGPLDIFTSLPPPSVTSAFFR